MKSGLNTENVIFQEKEIQAEMCFTSSITNLIFVQIVHCAAQHKKRLFIKPGKNFKVKRREKYMV